MRPTLAAVTRVPASYQTIRRFQYFHSKMGVTKTVIQEGNGPVPQKGQKVTIEYTGWLKDTSKPDNKGTQ
ncbi:MAG: peptidylprolyl isomerase [Massilia sp.]|jgi:FK506-binding protein 1|nr:peptidylprolyl isomerase [Massilia sp.]